MGGGAQVHGLSSAVFSDALVGSWIGCGAAGTGTSTHVGCQGHSLLLNGPCQNTGPGIPFWQLLPHQAKQVKAALSLP